MLPENYANMTDAYEAQKWTIPIYLEIIFYEPFLGLLTSLFAFYVIMFKAANLNPYFRRGMAEILVFPTVISLYIGTVFKPYAIAPFEVYWSCGYFNKAHQVWFGGLVVAILGCFFIFSLLFIVYIYIKAFVGRGLLHIGKSIKVIFMVGSICIPTMGVICTYLDYTTMEEKQKRDQETIIAGNPKNIMFFTEISGYILNMEGAGIMTYLQYGSIFFCAISGIFFGLFIFLRIIYILEKRSGETSQATKKLQKTFILVILVQIYVFIVFYGLPASALFLLMTFKIFALQNYPVIPYMVIHFMALPIAYSIMNLTLIGQVRTAFLKLIRWKKIIRRDNSVFVVSRHQPQTRTTRTTRSTRLARNAVDQR